MRGWGIAIGGALVLAVLALASPVAASPQPEPLCPVCGESFHENVTASDATLQIQPDGDVRWRVENELTEPTASRWREDPAAARQHVAATVGRTSEPPSEPDELDVTVVDGGVVVTFVDREAARQRFGLLVLPYLHDEGDRSEYVVNADVLAVRAPDGQRVVNRPDDATVEGDRAVWYGVAATDGRPSETELWTAPEPRDTYVVTGSGVTAGVRGRFVTALEPLDPALYGRYALGLLVVAGLAYGPYAVWGSRLRRRVVTGSLFVAAVPYLLLVASLHPLTAGGIGAGIQRFFLAAVAVLSGLAGGLLLLVSVKLLEFRAGRSS